jgi:antitoxin component of MazEF toxin-antitoxin module
MKPIPLKVARIGNSRGIRIPAATLARYHIGDVLLMEERSDGILLRPRGLAQAKLSWDETADAMVAERENWSDWEVTAGDGLEFVMWSAGTSRVSERASTYAAGTRPRRPRKKK